MRTPSRAKHRIVYVKSVAVETTAHHAKPSLLALAGTKRMSIRTWTDVQGVLSQAIKVEDTVSVEEAIEVGGAEGILLVMIGGMVGRVGGREQIDAAARYAGIGFAKSKLAREFMHMLSCVLLRWILFDAFPALRSWYNEAKRVAKNSSGRCNLTAIQRCNNP